MKCVYTGVNRVYSLNGTGTEVRGALQEFRMEVRDQRPLEEKDKEGKEQSKVGR